VALERDLVDAHGLERGGAPTTRLRIPLTTRQTRSKYSTFWAKRGEAGETVCGFNAVKGMPFWQKTSIIESLPQKASRRVAGAILSISSG